MNPYRTLELLRKTNHIKEGYKYFVGTTLKNPLTYTIGEQIVFKIRVKHMEDYLQIPYVWYSLIGEDGQNEEGYIPAAEDGWFYIETSLAVNGFVYIQAKACDENKQVLDGIGVYNGSAGADIGSIARATKMPSDYRAFWESLKAEVEATAPEVLLLEKREDPAHPDFEHYDMRIKVPGSDYVSVAVAHPKHAEKGSLKLAMFYQGYGVYAPDDVIRDGYLSVVVGTHAIPSGREPAFYEQLRDNELKGYGFDAEENKTPQTTYWAKMFMRDLQALRYFEKHELVNQKDYYFIGSSQGGMRACNMAAQFDKATALIMNVPWLSDIYGPELGGRRENTMPKGEGVTYFDTATAAQFVTCPAYIISGLGDSCCSASSQMAIFNALPGKKYIEFYQNKIHSNTIPRDAFVYTLGDSELASQYEEHTVAFYDWD